MAKSSVFVYKGQAFMKVIPAKALMNSTTIYEAVTRGSLFAVNLTTRVLTILPEGADNGTPS